jgi:hypothetical protein
MAADVTGTVEFLAEAAGMAARLRERGRSVFEIQYSGLSFGSWSLAAGTPKHRVQVVWDGREGELRARAAVFSDSQSRPAWDEIARERPEDRAAAALLRATEQIVLTASGAPAA